MLTSEFNMLFNLINEHGYSPHRNALNSIKKELESAKHADNKPIPFTPSIFDDGIAVIELTSLPKRTMSVSSDIYESIKNMSIPASKTAA